MAWALQQSKPSGALASSIVTTFNSTPTLGNLMLASVWDNNGTVQPTVSDSNGAWLLIRGQAGTTRGLWLFGLLAVASQPTAITAARSTDNMLLDFYAQFSGNFGTFATSSDVLDQGAGGSFASNTTTSGAPPSITTTVAGDLIFEQLGTNGAVTGQSLSDGSFTRGEATPTGTLQLFDYWKAASGTGTFNPSFSWTTARAAAQQVTGLKPAAGGATVTGRMFAMFGDS